MNPLGIYFGPKAISIVESKGKRLTNNIEIPQSTISRGELEEKVPAEVKIIEIIALFKDELRRNKIEAKEATLCLSGKDLIVRTFEMPTMPREELQSAINFEVKKYIPFKAEDLISDFQVEADKTNHSNLVLYMGIKRETLDKYVSILSQLNLKISAIEHSAFSILRCVGLAGLSDKGIVGLIGIDTEGQDEVNFSVLENGFPLFSRDISLTGGPEETGKPEEAIPGEILEKLKTEVRVSLDYYNRKFPQKAIKKVFIISNQDQYSTLEAFLTELNFSVQFVDVTKFIAKPVSYSLGLIKGFSASLSKTIKTNLKLNLLAAKTKIQEEKAAAPVEGGSLLQGIKLDLRIIILGALICLAPVGIRLYRAQPLRQELSGIMEIRPKVAKISPQENYEGLTKIDSEYKGKIDVLDNLIKKQVYATEVLDIIPRAMPKGVWLKNLVLNRKEEGRFDLNLEGIAYLVDSNQEIEAVNRFVSNLKENPKFAKVFKEINITSLDRREIERVSATNFSISCRVTEGRR